MHGQPHIRYYIGVVVNYFTYFFMKAMVLSFPFFPSSLKAGWTVKKTGLNIIPLPVMPTWHPCRLVRMTIDTGGLEIFCGNRYLKIC